MIDRVDTGKRALKRLSVPYVTHYQFHVIRKVIRALLVWPMNLGSQVVECPDFIAGRQHFAGQMGADKTCAARNEEVFVRHRKSSIMQDMF